MDIMGLVIEAAMLPFQHRGNGWRKLPVHPLGKPRLNGFQIRCYQNP